MSVFTDPYRLDQFDVEHSIDEDRFNVIGNVTEQGIILLTVTYTLREEQRVYRIISARRATKKRRKNTMTVTRTLDTSKPFKFTEEQLAELAALKKIPGEPDEDCPELTDEQLDQMIEARNRRLALQRKKVVSVRLSAEAILKAKAFGRE